MPAPRGDDTRPTGPAPAEFPGFGETATGAIASIFDYFHARLSLLILEGQEAKGALLWRIVSGVLGAFFLLIAYAAFCVGLIGLLSAKFSWAWPQTTLGLAAAHFIVGLIFLLAVRRRFQQLPFRDSIGELEKDREWLHRQRNRQARRH